MKLIGKSYGNDARYLFVIQTNKGAEGYPTYGPRLRVVFHSPVRLPHPTPAASYTIESRWMHELIHLGSWFWLDISSA